MHRLLWLTAGLAPLMTGCDLLCALDLTPHDDGTAQTDDTASDTAWEPLEPGERTASLCLGDVDGPFDCQDLVGGNDVDGVVYSARERAVVARLEDPDDLPPPVNEDVEIDLEAATPSPAGYGHYCSMTWPDGGWAMAWSTNGDDPCGWIESQTDPGGTVERAGMFASNGLNRATMRCRDGSIYLAEGWGPAALAGPFTVGAEKNLPGCVLTAAPVHLPVFASPFTPGTQDNPEFHSAVEGHNGCDFAQQDLYPVTRPEVGLPGTGEIRILNHEGEEANNYVDGHMGKDWVAPAGTPLFPAMRGRVIDARRYVTPPSCPTETQGEVWVEHTILRSPARYSETFVTGYMHVELGVFGPGAIVEQNSLIAHVSPAETMGCSSAPHLHFGVIRGTNTTHERRIGLVLYDTYEDQWGPGTIGNNSNSFPWHIDPYGWNAPVGFDPWAWKAEAPFGALSISLWQPGQAPPAGGWAPTW